MYRDHKIICTVFAGRRDRMTLLLDHLDALVACGLVDEVHLWDYCRTEEDRAWLRSLPTSLLVTGDEYLYSGETTVEGQQTYEYSVQGASNDIAMLLKGVDGKEYELVLGGWDNTASVMRQGRQAPEYSRNEEIRVSAEKTSVKLAWDGATLSVQVNDFPIWTVPLETQVASIAHSTGWGNAGIYSIPSTAATTPYRYCKPSEPYWTSYYSHYAKHAGSNVVLIKLDDDIVSIQQSTFAKFLDFRLDHPEFSLVFPNIVNNGACAHIQQQHGLLQGIELDAEMPGKCGMLWESAEKAAAVHQEFLCNPSSFSFQEFTPIPPHHRVSINAFAVLSDFIRDAFALAGEDDEHYLTELHPGTKAVFHGTYAAHLSFHSQDAGLDIPSLLASYATLKAEDELKEIPCTPEKLTIPQNEETNVLPPPPPPEKKKRGGGRKKKVVTV